MQQREAWRVTLSFGDQITALSEQLNEVKDQVANLAAENARLRAQAPSPAARTGDNGDERSPTLLSRRGLLAAGASATAAGLLIAGRATPALAANGDPVLLGDSTNSATADTAITTTSALGLKAESTSSSGIGVSGLASGSPIATTETIGVRGESTGDNGSAGVFGFASALSGLAYGVYGVTNTEGGAGVYGLSNSGICGVQGLAGSESGTGVFGYGFQVRGNTFGVRGQSDSPNGRGVQGTAPATLGSTVGVEGSAASTTGKGVYGFANATSGKTYGVYGQTNSPGGYALYGQGRLKVTGRSYLGTPKSAPADADLNLASISLYLDETNSKLKVRVKYSTGVLKTATIALI
jgi:hypothetical protein